MKAPKETGRQPYILETAMKVFARHGFKKTSMEDIAQAAQISRQGIYLHFKNKEDIFKASLLKMMNDSLAAATTALNDKDSPLQDKLLSALDGWFGQYVGLFHIEASDLRQHARQMLGTEIDEWKDLFEKKMVMVLADSSSHKEKVQHAIEITEILCACGMTWKHDLTSREEFLRRMKATLRICCQNL
jgi:AcrR family transcriptional regulator